MVKSVLMKRFRNKTNEQVPPSKEGLLDAEILGISPTTDFYTQHSWRKKYLPGLAAIAFGLTALSVGRSVASNTQKEALENRMSNALAMANVHRRTEGIYNSGMTLSEFLHSRGVRFSCEGISKELSDYFEAHKRSDTWLYPEIEPISALQDSDPVQPIELPIGEPIQTITYTFCGDRPELTPEDQSTYLTLSANLNAAMTEPTTRPNGNATINPAEVNYAVWQANTDYHSSLLGEPLDLLATSMGGICFALGVSNIEQERRRARIIEQDIARMAESIRELP